MVTKMFLAFALVFVFVATAATQDDSRGLSFAKSDDGVLVTLRAAALMGPHYMKINCWAEANTKRVHLEYTLFQNIDICKKSPQEVEVKWNLKDTGVTWENHKEFTYHVKDQEVRLNSSDVMSIAELLPEKQKITR